jgi:hypothetical protein
MTEAENMKAFEDCWVNGTCEHCSMKKDSKCKSILRRTALDLIKRKNAEIEWLEKNKRLADELIEQMRITINNRTTENQKLKLNNEELKIINKNLDKLFLKARAEAIKEFENLAEKRICEKVNAPTPTESYIVEKCIEVVWQIAKEMGVEL